MEKSMYSLILIDDVVKAVDKLAYNLGTSRSNLINQILAEYLSMLTPQKRIAEIFHEASQVMEEREGLRVQPLQSDNILVIKSVINYRYNPTIRYTVELSVQSGSYSGQLRVVSRTQSDALMSSLTVFYELWTQIESSCLKKPETELKYSISGGRFRRRLAVEHEGEIHDSHLLGQAIGNYIKTFDQAINIYFAAEFGVDMETYRQMEELYAQYLAEAEISI